ncbi:PqqD family protein [uncultured Ruminococcus sp.]|uniref:PqqD family protein n=1 Tax=uncultured Ruminococcus sp. TaxID=165186 RepID=UPI0025FFF91D|nr:PqqD family protein [uncultured Ruminococcus sp.]
MKLAVEMAVMEIDGEWNAVAVGEDSSKFHGMLRLNDSGAEIIKLLSEETTPENVHKALCKIYPESTVDEIGHMLADFLNNLLKEGLLAE